MKINHINAKVIVEWVCPACGHTNNGDKIYPIELFKTKELTCGACGSSGPKLLLYTVVFEFGT